jgi:hypothetical protein
MGNITVRAFLDRRVADLTAHLWDLSKATGQQAPLVRARIGRHLAGRGTSATRRMRRLQYGGKFASR